MYALKQLMQGDKINPKSPLAPNSRHVFSLRLGDLNFEQNYTM